MIQLTIKDAFQREALHFDLGSVILLEYKFSSTSTLPEWHVIEDGTGNKFLLESIPDTSRSVSKVTLNVTRSFKFGSYTVEDGSQTYSLNIPYRLGEKLPKCIRNLNVLKLVQLNENES